MCIITAVTYKVSDFYSQLQIVLLCLYPNATHILQPADVSAFKSLKISWKKSVLKWRQENLENLLTLKKMALLLEKAVKRFAFDTTTVNNGFKACGLYSWNPEVIEYLKCLAKYPSKSIVDDAQSSCLKSPNVITLETFIQLVGPDLHQELLLSSSLLEESLHKSKEFFVLKKLLNHLLKSESSMERPSS